MRRSRRPSASLSSFVSTNRSLIASRANERVGPFSTFSTVSGGSPPTVKPHPEPTTAIVLPPNPPDTNPVHCHARLTGAEFFDKGARPVSGVGGGSRHTEGTAATQVAEKRCGKRNDSATAGRPAVGPVRPRLFLALLRSRLGPVPPRTRPSLQHWRFPGRQRGGDHPPRGILMKLTRLRAAIGSTCLILAYVCACGHSSPSHARGPGAAQPNTSLSAIRDYGELVSTLDRWSLASMGRPSSVFAVPR